MNKKMELNQIKYFLEVAKNEHVTKSADNLHVAQPALTQSIHKLEEELEIPLFKHDGRNIKLTTYGQWLYKKLTPIVKEIDEIPEQLKQKVKTINQRHHFDASTQQTNIK